MAVASPALSNQQVRFRSNRVFVDVSNSQNPLFLDVLETSIWELGPGPNGTTELGFVTKNVTSGKIVLGNGIAHVIKKAGEKAKL